ncbi:MAG: hypothetical protein JWM74_297 [Myxococcaceae bacterium]|nr:hypothetical protein [Myxococcaceae bacterium]
MEPKKKHSSNTETKGGAGARGKPGEDPAGNESPKWEGGKPKGENEPPFETERDQEGSP